MADVSPNYAIRTFLPGASGVAIVAPIACTRVTITNLDTANAATIFSDPAVPATGKALAASGTETIQAGAATVPFGPGATVCFVTSLGSGGVVCTFTR